MKLEQQSSPQPRETTMAHTPYSSEEGTIRRELTAFWENVGDILDSGGEAFENHQKVGRLAERSPLANGLMCNAYQQLSDALNSHRTHRSPAFKAVLRKFGLELSLQILDERMTLEKAKVEFEKKSKND